MNRITQAIATVSYQLASSNALTPGNIQVLLIVANHGKPITGGEAAYASGRDNMHNYLGPLERLGLLSMQMEGGVQCYSLTDAGEIEVQRILNGPERVVPVGPTVNHKKVKAFMGERGHV